MPCGWRTTETVYAIIHLRVHKAGPAHVAAWIRGRWAIENKIPRGRDVTSTATAARSARASDLKPGPRYATPSSARYALPESPPAPPAPDITPAIGVAHGPSSSASPDDIAEALGATPSSGAIAGDSGDAEQRPTVACQVCPAARGNDQYLPVRWP